MRSNDELKEGALAFEQKHNSRYRYSKLKGKTPLKALAQSSRNQLRFTPDQPAPKIRLTKPESGKYHVIRFIRSDCKLNIFGEQFHLPPDLQYEYVVATIDIKEQKLKVFLDQFEMEEFDYKLR